jgi:hypothetical protein
MGEKGCLAKNLYKRLSSQTTVPEKWPKGDCPWRTDAAA